MVDSSVLSCWEKDNGRGWNERLQISLWFSYVGLFFLCKVSVDFCHFNSDSRHVHTFLRADKFGFTIESCSPPAFPAHKDRGHNVPPWGFTDHRAGGKWLSHTLMPVSRQVSSFPRKPVWVDFPLVWLISCGDLGFLLRSKYSSSLAREETAARMKSCFLCLLQWQGCCSAETALHTVLLYNTDCSWHCRAQVSPAVPAEHLSFCTHVILYMVYRKQGSTFRVINKW